MNPNDTRSALAVGLIALVVVLALVLLPVLLMPMMFGGMMGGWNLSNLAGWGGNMWWGWLLMLLFWALLIGGGMALVAWAARRGRVSPSGDGAGSRPNEALEILRQRYARGEITGEQFEQMKRDLRAD